MTKAEIITILKAEIERESGMRPDEIADDSPFHTLRLDSISAVFVLDEVGKKLNMELNPLFFWDYPTVNLLAGHIATLSNES